MSNARTLAVRASSNCTVKAGGRASTAYPKYRTHTYTVLIIIDTNVTNSP
jgi:hypothetical protein